MGEDTPLEVAHGAIPWIGSAAVPILSLGMRPWQAAGIRLVFFTGAVLQVKSLIRAADDRRWAIGTRAFHLAALALGLLWPWLRLPSGAAFVVPVGTRPAVIGAVETGVAVLVVVGGAPALG